MESLTRRALLGVLQLQVMTALLLFLPAGTLRYWQGWLFWALFTGSAWLVTLYLLKHDRDLVTRRLKAGAHAETTGTQKRLMSAAMPLFAALMLVPGLEYRLRGGSILPAWLAVLGDVLVLAGYALVFIVFRENTHASSVVEVKEGQRVISTGPYAVVRHPMYSGGVLMILAMPVALGSVWGLVPAVLLCGIIVARLLDEERYLAANLPGYDAYLRTVRRHLIPGVW